MSHPCRLSHTRVALLSFLSHSCRAGVARVALVSLLSGTYIVKYTRSNVTYNNSTAFEDLTVFPAKDFFLFIFLFLAKSISWNYLGFATISLFVSQFIAVLASISKFWKTANVCFVFRRSSHLLLVNRVFSLNQPQ